MTASHSLLPITHFEARLPALLSLLRSLVEMESPSTEKPAVDRLGEWVAARMRALGAQVERLPQQAAGDHWLGRWGDGRGGVLLLVHLDTVHPLGALSSMPWREQVDRVCGPGVLDMKAGLACALTAIQALKEGMRLPSHPITLLCTSDEEIGSHSSRRLIERLALEHEVVLCLEPGLPDGSLKTARKGVGIFQLDTLGRAAHAGTEPGMGINAVVEMCHQVLHLQELAAPEQGTTVNVGRIEGGTRSNVIPERCTVVVDVRIATPQEQERVARGLEALSPVLAGAQVQVKGEWNRPPMPRTPQIEAAYRQASVLAAELGMALGEGSTGGASDANFVAPLGVPLLDGLGPLGGGAHAPEEHVLLASFAPRCALLAALLQHPPGP